MSGETELLLTIIARLEVLQTSLDELRSEFIPLAEAAKLNKITAAALIYKIINDPAITPADWRLDGKRYFIRRASLSKFEKKRVE